MIPTIRLACSVAATVLLAACDMNKVAATVRVELESPTPEQTAAAAVVLQNRLSELVDLGFSKVTATPSGSGVEVVFTGDAPPDDLIRSCTSIQGVMRMYLEDSPITTIATDRDVEQATASEGFTGPVMNLQLSHAAGNRMLDVTRRNVGKVMVTSWDRKTETRATIRGSFGGQFQTSGLDFSSQKLWVAILSHGRLPVAVRGVEIRHPGT